MGFFRTYEHTKEPKDNEKSDRAKLVLTRKTSKVTSAEPTNPTKTDNIKNTTAESEKQPLPKTYVRKKTGPTMTRRQAENERMERLHPTLSARETKRRDRQARLEKQNEAWDRIENSPERVLLRNYIDSRWTIGEFIMPSILLVFAFSIISQYLPYGVFLFSFSGILMWLLMLVWFINVFFLWRGFKKELRQRHPGTSTKGLMMYMVSRSMMIRRWRRPGTTINRGDDY